MSSGRVISRKTTRLCKLAFLVGAAIMVTVATGAEWKLGGSVVTNVSPIFILVGFWLYFLRKAGVLTVADEVVDRGDHLAIRIGRKQATVPFSNIAIAVPIGLPGLQFTLLQPTELGKQVAFWVESKPDGEMTRVAYEISEGGDESARGTIGMNATEIRAVLDAQDTLVRDCAEGRLTFDEFLGTYGGFPGGYQLEDDTASAEGREALRLFRMRVAFHKQVAGAIAGLHGAAKLGSVEDSGAGDFLPVVGLMRLRELVARYPEFEATVAQSSAPR